MGRSSSRSKNPRPSKHVFPQCIQYGFNDHLFDDCVNYPICDICGSYDHDSYGYNRIIFLSREIKPINPQHVMKSCETCGSTVHTITNHNDIEWFRRGEELQAKKAKALKSTKAESSNANRSKTPTRSGCSRHMIGVKSYLHKYTKQPGPKVVFGDDSTCTTEDYGSIKFNNINIAETKRYLSDEYLHPYKPSQRYQTNSNDVSLIEPYEYPEPVILEIKVSSNQNGQTDQDDHNDQSVQNDEILNDDHSKHPITPMMNKSLIIS
ncbi:hypothetical protein Tco_1269510 [Tanacetum coccineum]